jgi:hypothetical protein
MHDGRRNMTSPTSAISFQPNADKRYKLIRKIKVSTSSEHDTLYFEDVLDPNNTSRDLYADKGYVDGEREARLTGQGWRMHIQRKGTKDKAVSATQEQRNKRIRQNPCTGRAYLCQPGADGGQGGAFHRLGTRYLTSELESRRIQFASPLLPDGVSL